MGENASTRRLEMYVISSRSKDAFATHRILDALLAAVDVEANFVVVKVDLILGRSRCGRLIPVQQAFQLTDLLSCMLLAA
jgi:hypothetical protein